MGAYAVMALVGAGDFFGLSRVLLDVGFMRPNGRKQEVCSHNPRMSCWLTRVAE